MARTVATSLTREDLDLLERCPGSTVSEKLRYCIKRTVKGESESSPLQSSGSEEEGKASANGSTEAEGEPMVSYDLWQLEKQAEEQQRRQAEAAEREAAAYEESCEEKDEQIASLQSQLEQEGNSERKKIEDSFDLIGAYTGKDAKITGFLWRLKSGLAAEGKTWEGLDPLVKSYFISKVAKNNSLEGISKELGIPLEEVKALSCYPNVALAQIA
jgi:hypothetical protein